MPESQPTYQQNALPVPTTAAIATHIDCRCPASRPSEARISPSAQAPTP